MDEFCAKIINIFKEIHPLDRVPRAGFLLRGVPVPESVSAHSHFLSLLALLVLEQFPDQWDGYKVLTLAIIHDLAESKMMDMPMPVTQKYFSKEKLQAEQAVFDKLMEGLSTKYSDLHREFHEVSSPEAKLVRGLDKVQMMLKVLNYEREHQGDLREFWENPKNFCDYGIEITRKLFHAICEYAGRTLPLNIPENM
ncbi:MAG TPA: HD domain-containing protein [Candidatus Hydrogenedens sp.]|nr:HD domain-containing protein [Candidatus Hydrogenedens sp.]HOK09872.1 HD domain-containing protein [Candidatus Hydrogenedens sp.]HOL19512.1 HD domain-containing protein [Candidatus Hydrogenedens sp.]HPP59384.1 HD domain-containing protein [Candidatus Hydrogenedens sp.]